MSKMKSISRASTQLHLRSTLMLVIYCMVAILFIGCGKENPKTAKKQIAVNANTKAESDTASKNPLPDEELEVAAESEVEPTKEEVLEEQQVPERILILTPGGPLIVDVMLTIDGVPHSEPLQEIVNRVLAAADTNSDCRATWQEWKDNSEFFEQEFAESTDYSQRQITQWAKNYDQNSDKQMQSSEAAAWLGRKFRGSARSFSLRSNRSYLAQMASSSRIWQLLDHNRDGLLSHAELRDASSRFWAFDANDDRTIITTELASLSDQLEMQMGQSFQTSRNSGRYAAVHLDDSFERDSLDPLLSDLYAPRQSLCPDSFPDLPSLFEKLDLDQNEYLSGNELVELFNIEPMLDLMIAFNSSDDTSDAVTIRLESHCPELTIKPHSTNSRAVLALGKTRLIISAQNLVANYDSEAEVDVQIDQEVQQSQIRLMVHDQCDTLFQELDANGDRRLGERELHSSGEQLSQYDANEDQNLDDNELPYQMIVAFMRGEQPDQRSFYLPNNDAYSFAMPYKGNSPPLWFQKADFNSDGDLSRREFLGSSDQFVSLDKNTDGYIDAQEAKAFDAEHSTQ